MYLLLSWLHNPLLGLARFQFLTSYTLSVGLLGRGISLLQGRYLHTEWPHTDIHASSGIWTTTPVFERAKAATVIGTFI
jgi:hypothetical protein